MKILLLSPNGMLGTAWKRLLEAKGIDHTAIGRPNLDLTRPASIDAVMSSGYSHIINCAAWTDVDAAEEHEHAATVINGAAVRLLAEHAAEINAQLVHYSTDYVFNGQATSPYPIDAPHDPVNAYGRSKAAGEKAIRQSRASYLVIRTSWVYAPWGNNFVQTMRKLTADRDELKVVADQRGRPTSAEHLAMASLELMEKNAEGFLHVCDGGECTWHELASHVAESTGSGCVVQPCTTSEFPRPAKRPSYSVLDLKPSEDLIGPMPDWRDNVDRVLSHS
ncbi:MAG: dTDP-4-dehydrorhamnose reductase [Phycisphaeraceae bacterium]